MVDRVSLLRTLASRLKPTGTQEEAIRRALDKALAEVIGALPLNAAVDLPAAARAELEIVLQSLDAKVAEKLAALWEPARPLDADLKGVVKKDLIDLLHRRRLPYKPIAVSLTEARSGDIATYRSVIGIAPNKDLKSLLKKWDANYKPVSTTRQGIVDRLSELLDGASPVPKTTTNKPRPQKAAKAPKRSTQRKSAA